MKKRLLSLLFVFILSFMTLASPGALRLRACGVSSQEIGQLVDGIIEAEKNAAGASSVQALLDGAYADKAGVTSDWFAFSIIRYKGEKYDYSAYASALNAYIKKSDRSRERTALLFAAMGARPDYIASVLDGGFDGCTLMQLVFRLHLMNNGYTARGYTVNEVVDEIISRRKSDGGWAVGSGVSDVDVTAMVLQSLAPRRGSVGEKIDAALALLSERQGRDGSYSSYGKVNPESAAQVITALTTLGIDPLSDSRFIKNGRSAVDAMLDFRLADGRFAHESGGGQNVTATSQALYSLVSIELLRQGRGGLYTLDKSIKVTIKESDGGHTEKQTQPTTRRPAAVPDTTAKKEETTTKQTQTEKTGRAAETTRPEKTSKPDADPAPGDKTEKKNEPVTEPGTKEETAAAKPKNGKKAVKATSAAREESSEEETLEPEETGAPAPEAVTDGEEETSSGHDPAAEKAKDKTEEGNENKNENGPEKPRPVKAFIIGGIWAAAALAAAIVFFAKKRKAVNFIAIAAAAALFTGAAAISDVKAPEDYFKAQPVTAESTVTVTMSVSCATVAGEGKEEITPSDGVILPETEFTLPSGATVYDCLIAAVREEGLRIDDSSNTLTDHSMAYIAGINGLYEFDYGDLSGWMYAVNGDFADRGCGEYALSDGDVITWEYTRSLGEDLK